MNIVIVGLGKFGKELTKHLSRDGHDIIVIDNIESVVSDIVNEYDVKGYVGNGASYNTLTEASVSNYDLLIAVTSSDEVNILSCLIAKKIGIKHTIGRVRNPEYDNQSSLMMSDLGINLTINPDLDTAREIYRILRFPSALKVETFGNGLIDLVEYKIDKGSPLIDNTLFGIQEKYGVKMLICIVERNNDAFIPKGDFILKLIQGQQSEIEFDTSEGVTLAAVCYNAEVEKEKQKSRSAIKGTDSLTTIQRPDIVLRLSKEGDDIKYTYLFDAKYRIDDSRIGDMDVPPEDAIDQLHRYRDAIYFTGEEILKKEIVAGYILFPGKVSKEALDPNVSEDKKYYYQKSNEKIGIGAFPLRPTQKSIIDEDGNLVLDANDSEEALERQIRQWIEEENPREKLLEECVPQKGLTYEYEDVIANYLIIDVLSDVGNDIDAFKNGEAKKYFFGKRGPAEDVDLSSIKYLVPVMERNVAGYYRIKSMKFNFEEVRFEVELENYKSLNSSISYNDSNARGIMKSAEEFKSMIEGRV